MLRNTCKSVFFIITHYKQILNKIVLKTNNLISATCKNLYMKPPKMTPNSLKSKLNQKPQFPPTLLANFWYFDIRTYVSNGKWQKFGQSPLWKTFLLLDHCVLFKQAVFEGLVINQKLESKSVLKSSADGG